MGVIESSGKLAMNYCYEDVRRAGRSCNGLTLTYRLGTQDPFLLVQIHVEQVLKDIWGMVVLGNQDRQWMVVLRDSSPCVWEHLAVLRELVVLQR